MDYLYIQKLLKEAYIRQRKNEYNDLFLVEGFYGDKVNFIPSRSNNFYRKMGNLLQCNKFVFYYKNDEVVKYEK